MRLFGDALSRGPGAGGGARPRRAMRRTAAAVRSAVWREATGRTPQLGAAVQVEVAAPEYSGYYEVAP